MNNLLNKMPYNMSIGSIFRATTDATKMILKALGLFLFPAILPLSLTFSSLQTSLGLPAKMVIPKTKEQPWTNLIDPALSKWENYLSYRHKLG
ncbi:MAG TPA: hypothetical protein VF679_06385, partial [Pedobacter sp.]